jgi:hypothetical protein
MTFYRVAERAECDRIADRAIEKNLAIGSMRIEIIQPTGWAK